MKMALGNPRKDVHPFVPQDALLKVGEAGVRHEAEDLLVHGDDLEGVVREYRQSRPRGKNGK
jgi:hypothetical protein